MKIDKRNYRHWLALLTFGLVTLLGIAARPFAPRRKRPLVLLYGHKLNGNLLALYRYLHVHSSVGIDAVFLGMDAAYVAELRRGGNDAACAVSLSGLRALTRCSAIVTSHGLHSMRPLLRFSDIKFFDVWHGFGFKGFDADDYRVIHRYDEVWVASETQREQYIRMAGFDPAIVRPTGYGRTDALVKRSLDADVVKRSLGLDPETCGKLVLFAPTWQQDDPTRSMFPFGMSAAAFLDALEGFAQSMDATVLLRAHLNTALEGGGEQARVVQVPFARYPDTESILFACDALVCDWSSIAFDYLVLDRPTFFLDVPAPFAKGHSLGPECRFGPIVRSMDALLEGLRNALADPQGYWSAHGQAHLSTKEYVWGSYADGNATQRYVERLLSFLEH